MRRTKIIATIGPACRRPAQLEELLTAGVDVARLNFSHGSHEGHAENVVNLRAAAAQTGRTLAILQDLAGPKIRVGEIEGGEVTLEQGQPFVLTTRRVPGDAGEVSLEYHGLPRAVAPGDPLLLADGRLELRVDRTTEVDVVCTVVVGGRLGSRKGINVPTRSLDIPILTAKDHADLAFGLAQGVDYVAASFVRTVQDVREVKEAIAACGHATPLIAKIEKFEALDHIDEILTLVDGIMVARGDLGVEIPLEKVPSVQKRLIARANRAGKPVITATQMLVSMVEATRPTRAEATDVANAILDGTDAVMLSEETAVGHDPAGAVRVMDRIAREIETSFPDEIARAAERDEGCAVDAAVALAACRMAAKLDAVAIITCTQSGSTTRKVAKHRPRQPILAVTPSEETLRRLALVWGAVPLRVPHAADLESIERVALAAAREAGHVTAGQRVVLTAGLPFATQGTTNLVRVLEVPGN